MTLFRIDSLSVYEMQVTHHGGMTRAGQISWAVMPKPVGPQRNPGEGNSEAANQGVHSSKPCESAQ